MKAPVHVLELPGVASLELHLRWTFFAWFLAARRRPADKLGWLLDGTGAPATIATLAAWSGIPRSTAHRHANDLLERGLLQKDLLGRLLVPLVVTTERRFARPTASDDVAARPVDNPQLPLPPPSHGWNNNPRMWDGASLYEVQTGRDVRPVDVVNPVDNQLEAPGFGPRWDLVPDGIDPTSDIAYLLARLAERHDVWARTLGDRKDAANIARLAMSNPAELYEALAQESLEPAARNPAAWLNATVRVRVEAREEEAS